MDRYSESHLEEFERRINAFRAWLDEHPETHVPWGRWIADEGYAIVLGELRRVKHLEQQIMAGALEAEAEMRRLAAKPPPIPPGPLVLSAKDQRSQGEARPALPRTNERGDIIYPGPEQATVGRD